MIKKIQTLEVPIIPVIYQVSAAEIGKCARGYNYCFNTTIRPDDEHLMDLRIYLHFSQYCNKTTPYWETQSITTRNWAFSHCVNWRQISIIYYSKLLVRV